MADFIDKWDIIGQLWDAYVPGEVAVQQFIWDESRFLRISGSATYRRI
jgi:hypothetical protein